MGLLRLIIILSKMMGLSRPGEENKRCKTEDQLRNWEKIHYRNIKRLVFRFLEEEKYGFINAVVSVLGSEKAKWFYEDESKLLLFTALITIRTSGPLNYLIGKISKETFYDLLTEANFELLGGFIHGFIINADRSHEQKLSEIDKLKILLKNIDDECILEYIRELVPNIKLCD